MGRRGPAPIPSALRILKGSKRRSSTREPQPAPGPPSVPRWVEASVEAADFWRRVVTTLPAGVVTVADGPALEALTACWIEVQSDRRAVEEHGRVLVLRDDTGAVRSVQPSPAATRLVKLLPVLRGLLAEFGLSPSSRTRVQTARVADPEIDAFERFLSARGA